MWQVMKPASVRRLVAAATVGLALSVAACGDDDDDPTGPPSAADTYVIASIEQEGYAECTLGTSGCTLNETGSEVVVLEEGVLNLDDDGSFTLVVSGTTDGVDHVLGSVSGTWVRTQSGVTLNATGVPVPVSGTFSSSAEEELVFLVPATLFSSTSGAVTVTFDRQ